MSHHLHDSGAWCIYPDALDSTMNLLAAPEAELRALASPARSSPPSAASGEIAVLRALGPLVRYDGLLTDLLGWPSIAGLALQLATAIDNPDIKRIVLEIDSPGGTAAGVGELAAMIRRSPKPVTAYVDGMAASAAYWLGSAAHEVVVSSTAMLGSIGVVAIHRREEKPPIKVVSSQSPLKQASPETADGRAEIQRVVDQLASVFISDVARYRATTAERVTTKFGRGSLLVGAHAVSAGMADRLGSLAGVIAGTPPLRASGNRTMTHAQPSALERYNRRLEELVAQGIDRPIAILRLASEQPQLAQAAALERSPPPPDAAPIVAEYRTALDALIAGGIDARMAPMALATHQPQLARRYADACRVGYTQTKTLGISHD